MKNPMTSSCIGTVSWAEDSVFATGDFDGNIAVCDIRTRKVRTLLLPKAHVLPIAKVAWRQGTYQVASGGRDEKLGLWELRGGTKAMEAYN